MLSPFYLVLDIELEELLDDLLKNRILLNSFSVGSFVQFGKQHIY